MQRAFAFEQAVLRAIRAHGAIADGDRVLVAVSGGADSTALLAVLEALRRRGDLPIELAVGHLNHHLRGAESDCDAAAVAALAATLGLPCFVGDADGLAADAGNREARARLARYAFLSETARSWRAQRTAVAHTRDDQAETVLMRLARGAGPASLGAMQPVRPDGLIRPLLDQSRAACVVYLRERGVGWVEDSSNGDETLFRNLVRRRLLPQLETELGVDVRERLARFATQLREESALAEQRIADLLGPAVPGAGLAIATIVLAGPGAARLVHAWLARAGVRASTRQVESVLAIAGGDRPSSAIDLAATVRVVRRYAQLSLELGAAEGERIATIAAAALGVPGSASIPGWEVSSDLPTSLVQGLPAAPATEHAILGLECILDLECIRAPLSVRGPRAGDRVRLVYGRRKLADILIDARIPRQERKALAVVSSGEDILWVPGVIRSSVAAASPSTRTIAMLHAHRTA